MAWKDGFKIGYETGRIEIPSNSEQLNQFQKSIDQEKLLEAQKEQAEIDRMNKSIDDVDADVGVIFKEDFDDTGIFDVDVFADKLLESFRNATLKNTYIYSNKGMSEQQYKANQRGILASYSSYKNIYQNINAKAKEQSELQQLGKDNIVNTFRSEYLAHYGKQVRFGTDSKTYMPQMSTLTEDGREIVSPTSFIKTLLTNDAGADIDSAVNDLVTKKGSAEYFSKDLGTEYKNYGFRTDNIKSLVKKKAGVFNEAQVVDAAFKLGILTDDEELANPKEGVEYMDYLSWATLDREKITDLKGKVIDKMTEYTEEMLDLKFSSKQQKPTKEDEPSFDLPVVAKTGIETKDLYTTIMKASGLEESTDKAVSTEQKKELAKNNPDLFNSEGVMKSGVKISRIDLPTDFSKSDISSLGITSTSEKEWKNIEGVHLLELGKTYLDSGDQVKKFGFRLHGSVLDKKAKVSEGATTVSVGENIQIKAGTEEVRYDTMEDVSKPIDNKQIGRVFKTLIKNNDELKRNYEIAKKRAEDSLLDTSKPEVLNYIIGTTIEEFYINR